MLVGGRVDFRLTDSWKCVYTSVWACVLSCNEGKVTRGRRSVSFLLKAWQERLHHAHSRNINKNRGLLSTVLERGMDSDDIKSDDCLCRNPSRFQRDHNRPVVQETIYYQYGITPLLGLCTYTHMCMLMCVLF